DRWTVGTGDERDAGVEMSERDERSCSARLGVALCVHSSALGSEGATACSHGWSEAEPVEDRLNKAAPQGQRMCLARKLAGLASFAPCGANSKILLSTGSASLHPWLQSVAPPEPKDDARFSASLHPWLQSVAPPEPKDDARLQERPLAIPLQIRGLAIAHSRRESRH